jgi:4-amino-4-deoxy-L-arabinose transferase-like glycosyltransferase
VSSLATRVGASRVAAGWTAASPRTRIGAICVGAGLIGAWNALHYPPQYGYDAAEHMAYADGLVPGGRFPQGVAPNEYYTPPGYYAVAGTLDWLARRLTVGEPHRAGAAVNVLFLLGTVLLVWLLARELFPERELLALAAAAFTALLPVAVKVEAMFHPETMSMFFTTLALWLCVRTFSSRRYVLPLGVALGLAQLVRVSALWVVFAVAVALAAGRLWRRLAIVLVLAALIPAAWYVHQGLKYGSNALYGAAPGYGASRTASTTQRPHGRPPFWDRRPLRFYVDLGVPDVVRAPFNPRLNNLLLPTTYSELWGDYVGVWAWVARSPADVPSPTARRGLQIQALVGLLPTAIATCGLVLLLARSRTRPELLAPALLPVLGLAGYLFFTVNWALQNGTMLKATYMLSTTAGWALGFGYVLTRIRGRARRVVVAALAVCALAELPFLVYA